MRLSAKTTTAVEALRRLISGSRRPLITVHRDPDTDAIGSALAWAELLKQTGAQPTIWVADELDAYLRWLPGVDAIQRDWDDAASYDAIWVLDCSNLERVRQHERITGWQGRCPIVNIDHHADNSLFGDVVVVDVISSVGEFLVWIAEQLALPVTPTIATCLYAAICFDTGRFLYSNTTAQTLEAAAILVRTGINPGDLGRQMFESVPSAALSVLNVALSRMVIEPERRLAYTSLPADVGVETIKAVDFIRQIEDADIVVVFRDQGDGTIRVNLRSKRDIAVNTIAHQFGGGGHAKASGIKMVGSLETVMDKVLFAVRNATDAVHQ
ncbi:bifunctional oligoribonuclease/PAP phosphatase NrnA [bacterium]|nr:bifunctional oligoribonuclease/PAP phosphatase NrnA [bacterium]